MLDKRLLVVIALLLPHGSGNQEQRFPRPYRKRTLVASGADKDATQENADGFMSSPSSPSRRRRRKGRLSFDLHGHTMHIVPPDNQLEVAGSFCEHQYDEASLTITPKSALRLGKISLSIVGAVFTAFMGTLRLLAPL
jgi:hypothetical protein